MTSKRKISAKEFINDIRTGLGSAQLMEKYKLTPHGLRRIFRTLVQSSAMTKVEIEGQLALYEELTGVTAVRRHPRKRIDFPVHIYDGVDPVETGLIEDVSESGVRVKGIKTKVGEKRTFIVRLPAGMARPPFAFDAVCRWTLDGDADPQRFMAGFEITSISHIDSEELQKLLLE